MVLRKGDYVITKKGNYTFGSVLGIVKSSFFVNLFGLVKVKIVRLPNTYFLRNWYLDNEWNYYRKELIKIKNLNEVLDEIMVEEL